MKIRCSLVWMFLRQVSLANMAAFTLGFTYVLGTTWVLDWRNPYAALLILGHSVAIAALLGRYRSSHFAFLYTRGYTRDELWLNKMAATLLSVMAVWLPVALMVWLGIRSAAQEHWHRSPYFPIMQPREAIVPWAWLAGYAILVSLFHYVWIRRAQPLRGENGVVLLAIGVVVATGTLMTFRWHYEWFRMLCFVLAGIMIVTTLVAGRVLHRTVEVL